MATTITNKTRKPLSVPLGHGKKLYLGPGKSGDVAANDMELPAVKALVADGSIEVAHGRSRTGAGGSDARGRPSGGHASSGGPHRGGDR